MNNKPININTLPSGDYNMKIINANKWVSDDKSIGGLGVIMQKNGSQDIYRFSLIYFENGALNKESFGYKQLTEKLLPALDLSYSDIDGANFNKELFVNKQIKLKMIQTKKDPSKTWAKEITSVSGNDISCDNDDMPWDEDIPF